MASLIFKLDTEGKQGPIKVTLRFPNKQEGDQWVCIGREKEVSDDNHIWRFVDKSKFKLFPKTAFDTKLRTKK